MKKLTTYLKDNESSLISLNEKLIINKNYKQAYSYAPTTWNELRQIIKDRYKELGPGTEQEPINFNDIDVSRITTFFTESSKFGKFGIFQFTKFEYIDVSKWDVSNAENMDAMFYGCDNLISIGDISNWNVSNVKNMDSMFRTCKKLESIGDLSNWNVSNVEIMQWMFSHCKHLKTVGDLSKWDISGVTDMQDMFYNSGITNRPSWYKE